MEKTETIRFKKDKAWWEFQTYLTVAQERKWLQHAMDSQETFKNPDPELIDSLARRMDELVVGVTTGWSYGEVDLETFHTIPSHHYAEVADRMGDLYSPLVVKSFERGLRIYSSILNEESQSEPSSQMP